MDSELELVIQVFLRAPAVHDSKRFFTYSKRVKKYTGAAYRHDPVSVWERFPNMHDSVHRSWPAALSHVFAPPN